MLNPPTVEGWHTGKEWIDSGTLVERVNFAAGEMGRTDSPGIKDIVSRLAAQGDVISADDLLDGCLQLLGGYSLMQETRDLFLSQAVKASELHTGSEEFASQVSQLLQLIVATQEYQFA